MTKQTELGGTFPLFSAELIADLDSIGESSNVMSSRGRA